MWPHDRDPNPLFRGEGSPAALGDLLQLWGGSEHQFGSAGWQDFGRCLVRSFRRHIEAAGFAGSIRDLAAAQAWSALPDATAFFDENIPRHARGKQFIFW